MKTSNGRKVEKYEIKVTNNKGFTTTYLGSCPRFLEDGGVVWARPNGFYIFMDRLRGEEEINRRNGLYVVADRLLEDEERNRRSGFASHPLLKHKGNKNG